MCENFPKLELVRARPIIPLHAKSQPLGSSSFFNQFCTYKYTSAHTLARSVHDVSCANNNRFAVVVCFRFAFHASGTGSYVY